MHSRSKDSQTTLATKRVISGQCDRRIRANQGSNDQLSEKFPEVIDIPNSVAKESVVIGEVPVANRIAGNDQIGDEAMSGRDNPAGHQQPEGSEAGLSKNGCECA